MIKITVVMKGNDYMKMFLIVNTIFSTIIYAALQILSTRFKKSTKNFEIKDHIMLYIIGLIPFAPVVIFLVYKVCAETTSLMNKNKKTTNEMLLYLKHTSHKIPLNKGNKYSHILKNINFLIEKDFNVKTVNKLIEYLFETLDCNLKNGILLEECIESFNEILDDIYEILDELVVRYYELENLQVNVDINSANQYNKKVQFELKLIKEDIK